MTGVPGTVGRPGGLPAAPPGIRREFAQGALAKALARIPVPALVLRALPFFTLALFATAHWVALVEPAPTRRALVASFAATAGGILIALSARLRRAPGIVVRVALLIAIAVITLTAIGIRFKLLMPAGWGTLSDRVTGGLSVVGAVTQWPYAGPNVWLRLTTLMVAPLTLTVAAAMAFWPDRPSAAEGDRNRRGLRFGALALLIALYAVAVAARPFDHQTLRGFGLLACLAAWLWVPRLRGRDAAAAVMAIAIAGLVGLGLTAKVASSEPWIDYRQWSWTLHKERTIAFDWRHSYGPLSWPRKGTTLLLIRAKQAHYWKAETLDRFDGTRWTTVPMHDADPSIANVAASGNPKWTETVRVTVRGLRSDLVIGPGSLYDVKGTPGDAVMLSNGTYLLDGELQSGDTYTASGYTPDPSVGQMSAAPPPVRFFSRYTTIGLPQAGGFVSTQLTVPLRGRPGSGSPTAAQELEASRYARIYRLAKHIAAGAVTNYDVVRNVGAWLESHYTYSESVPNRRYPLESFLFTDKKGYCQYFSGSAALMLRMLGIPARVASGFAPGTLNTDTKEYVVRDLDAHSWIEVWFSGIGWVPFDPTPALAPAASQAASFAPLSEIASAARGDTKDRLPKKLRDDILASQGKSGGGLAAPAKRTPWGAIVLATIAFVSVFITLIALLGRSRLRRRPPPPPCGDAEVDHLVRLLARLGLDIAPGTTLYALEHRLQRLAGPEAAEYARRLRRRRFGDGGEPAPGRGEQRRLRQMLAEAVEAGPLARMQLALPDNPLPRSALKLPRLQRPR